MCALEGFVLYIAVNPHFVGFDEKALFRVAI
jgi:hypothetical protein